MQDIEVIVARAAAEFAAAGDPASLENAKAKYLGKAGELTGLMKQLGSLPPEERKAFGQKINAAKQQIETALDTCRKDLELKKLESRLAGEALDVTLPGRGRGRGGLHPISRTWRRIEEIFGSIGFDVADGPEIETDWYNFTALNNPENHPARSMQDTFYVDMNDAKGLPLLLRTHTSPMQVRYARMHKPPIKDRAWPHLPRRLGRHALADVPPGRGPVDRPGHQLRGPEGRVRGFPAPLLRVG